MTGKWTSCKIQRLVVTRRKFSKRKCGELLAEWPRRGHVASDAVRTRPGRLHPRTTIDRGEKKNFRLLGHSLGGSWELSPFLGKLRMTLTAARNFSSVLIASTCLLGTRCVQLVDVRGAGSSAPPLSCRSLR